MPPIRGEDRTVFKHRKAVFHVGIQRSNKGVRGKKVRSKNFILKQFKDKSNKQFSNTQELREHNSTENLNKAPEAEFQPTDR